MDMCSLKLSKDLSVEKNCQEISEDVINGKVNIVTVVEQLGPMLTDLNPEQRAKGTTILSNVLEKIPNDLLSSTQLNFICTFYADRLKDHHQVVPTVLKGICEITKMKNIPEGAATKILSTIFQEVPCQQQQQQDRLNIYKIIQGFMTNKLSELQAMSFDLVYGVITAMDSERDPKNLKFLFTWLPSFLVNVKLGHLTEEMFEVMACYFPIDFRAPSNDPNKISREELALALCSCLCALPEFGEFCFPLVLEKLSSSLKVAKTDSIDLLIEGCKSFSEDLYITNFNVIWNQCHQEIFTAMDPEIHQAFLNLLCHTLSKISKKQTEGIQANLLDKISSLKANLLPDNNLFKRTSQIFVYISRASEQCCELICKEILPLYIDVYKIASKAEEQINIFEEIHVIVENTMKILQNYEQTRKSIVELALKTTINQNETMQSLAFDLISTIVPLMSIEERNVYYESLKVLLIKPQNKFVRASIHKSFTMFAKIYTDEIKNILANIQVNGEIEESLLLDSLKEIIVIADFSAFVLQTYINNIREKQTKSPAISNLKVALKSAGSEKAFIFNYCIEQNLLNVLYDLVLAVPNGEINSSINLLNDVKCIFIQFAQLNLAFNFEGFAENVCKNYEASQQHVNLIILFGILSRLKVVKNEFYRLIYILPQVVNATDELYVKEEAVYLLANLVNRIKDEDQLENYLKTVEETITSVNCEESMVLLISFLTKSLLMKGSKFYTNWKEKLFELLENSEKAAESFKILLSDNFDCLSQESNCVIRLLYKQRFFVDACTTLINECDNKNSNYLTAYGFLIQEVPLNVFKMQFKQVLKLTIFCMDSLNNADTIRSVLLKLLVLLETKDELMEEHLQEFIPRFLRLAKFTKSMRVRITALLCLKQYTVNYPIYKLLPFKQEVTHQLIDALDDPKRLVRKEAVASRSSWILLDAPI